MFIESFGPRVSEGDKITCEVDGFTCTATLYNDDDASPPWKRHCGHGPVTDWLTEEDRRPGYRMLNADHHEFRYYDFKAAVKLAKADKWGVTGGRKEGESAAAYATRAAERDYEVLRAWCKDEWSYFGVAVTVSRAGVTLTGKYDHALWGVEGNYPESDNSYLAEVATEQLSEALDAARAKLKELCACEESK